MSRPRAAVSAILLLLVCVRPADAQTGTLRFASRPRLVECQDRPCFRMDIVAVDAQQQPMDLPDQAQFDVSVGDEKLPNVFMTKLKQAPRNPDAPASSSSSSSSRPQVPRVSFILFDTSGSMNQKLGTETKFAIAKRQLDLLFEGFRDGIDRIAIVPFDSQQVTSRIRRARFATTRAAAVEQVNALAPNRRGNTALYSAVRESLRLLEPYTRTGAQVSLIIFTDGQNDVGNPGDDPGLLGDEGLEQVKKTERDLGVTTYAIGYGASGVAFNEPALRSLAYPNDSNYFGATDEARLAQIFQRIKALGLTGVRLLAGPLPKRREQLQAQSLVFRVTSGNLSADSPAWEGAALGVPPYEGDLTPEERAAVLKWPVEDVLPSVLIRVIVLLTYSVVLAALWFGLPRLIWPERYIPKPAFAAPKPRVAAAPRGPGRPGAPAARPGPGGRPEVTIPAARPAAPPPRPGAPAAAGAREGSPVRQRPAPAAQAPRSREPAPPLETDETTRIFIPPAKKPGRDG
jgi:Mg-chelatase subunit ChlD